MKLIIVRHGETLENTKGITQGQSNFQLTQNGIEQAKKVSNMLKNTKIDIAFSSDLDRTVDTCIEILKFHNNAKFIKTPILREQSKGIFEGKTREEKSRLLKESIKFYHEWAPTGGESLIEVWERVIPFFEKIKEEYPDKNVLFVSHGGPISCLLTYLHNREIKYSEEYVPKENTSMSIISIQGRKIRHSLQ